MAAATEAAGMSATGESAANPAAATESMGASATANCTVRATASVTVGRSTGIAAGYSAAVSPTTRVGAAAAVAKPTVSESAAVAVAAPAVTVSPSIPWANAQEDAAVKPIRPIITVRRARVRVVGVIPPLAGGRAIIRGSGNNRRANTNPDSNLGFR